MERCCMKLVRDHLTLVSPAGPAQGHGLTLSFPSRPFGLRFVAESPATVKADRLIAANYTDVTRARGLCFGNLLHRRSDLRHLCHKVDGSPQELGIHWWSVCAELPSLELFEKCSTEVLWDTDLLVVRVNAELPSLGMLNNFPQTFPRIIHVSLWW